MASVLTSRTTLHAAVRWPCIMNYVRSKNVLRTRQRWLGEARLANGPRKGLRNRHPRMVAGNALID